MPQPVMKRMNTNVQSFYTVLEYSEIEGRIVIGTTEIMWNLCETEDKS